jgi:Protein of unknown function (DUF5818)
MKRIFLSLAGFVTLFGFMAAPVQSTASAISRFQAQVQPEAKTFTGTILKNGQNFVLSDPVTKSSYTLDNPEKASPYEGKRVKVTGTLDAVSNLIQVETIQEIV